ncbi:host specificity protein J, partial [Escherichia coli]|nr:host specificity protein J [Escherichia coli]
NLINGSGKPVSVAITAHPAPDRIQVSTLPDGVETYGVWGLSLPSLRRLHPGKHGRHLCHHGGAARTGKGSHRG